MSSCINMPNMNIACGHVNPQGTVNAFFFGIDSSRKKRKNPNK